MNIDPKWFHLRREENENRLHLSHLFQYVSAYENCPERLQDLRDAITDGLKQAKLMTTPQIVDQDGEMFFVCHPAGTISLCLRWKNYEIAPRDDFEKLVDPPLDPVHGPYCTKSSGSATESDLVFCGLPLGHWQPCDFSRSI